MNGGNDTGPGSRAQTPRPQPKAWDAAVRGLAVGVATVTAAALAAGAVIELMGPKPPLCHSDNPCLPDLSPVVAAAGTAIVVLVGLGPLLARLLRLPFPWSFVLPAMWVFVLLCSSPWLLLWSPAGPAPVLSIMSIVSVTYSVIAVLGIRAAQGRSETGSAQRSRPTTQ